jgi:hypothetical protein
MLVTVALFSVTMAISGVKTDKAVGIQRAMAAETR